MNAAGTVILSFFRDSCREAVEGWNRFWFTPANPATLGMIRIFAGAMLLYTHLVWTIDLQAFFGPHSWISPAVNATQLSLPDVPEVRELDLYGGRSFVWSIFDIAKQPSQIWAVHIVALVTFALLTVGLWTRVVAVLAWVFAVSYVQRAQGALFGLDQINTMLAMYLMVGSSGACYSLDSWLTRRKNPAAPAFEPSTSANIAIRLIQLHMCVIYMFAGIGKFVGASWWNGTGLWGGVANLEYQSLDATWLAFWPHLSAFLSHLTVYWEAYYCVLIWPRALRPWMLLIAVPLHLGIAVFMGMITFGLIMLVGNLAFVSPDAVRATVSWLFRRTPRSAAADPPSARQQPRGRAAAH
ncbi:MAG: HTTM domain-containing protein [Pirellulales bacterium]